MWVEEFSIENIRCFEKVSIKLARRANTPFRWITLLGENGAGKSTLLQAMGLLLAGPEGTRSLLPRPDGWVRDESKPGKMTIRIHQGVNDPGQFGGRGIKRSFSYSYFVTGNKTITWNQKQYAEPIIGPNPSKTLSWLRQNAFSPKSKAWFATGYGAFRRLTRTSQILIPRLEPQARFTNFTTQFNENEPLSTFELWMVHLDYRISKSNGSDKDAKRLKEIGIEAINRVLPKEVVFDSVTADGKILFTVDGERVPTISLSDGYRSILALTGDLIWRLILAFPDSDEPLNEEGVLLIDELDIHLHPVWQRDIAHLLREQFPNLQFIVATHSPFIAAGAGDDALTLKFNIHDNRSEVEVIAQPISALNVDGILKSPAFELVSTFSPQTQEKINRYDELTRRLDRLTDQEREEHGQLSLFMEEAKPFGGPPIPGSLEDKIEKFLEEKLN